MDSRITHFLYKLSKPPEDLNRVVACSPSEVPDSTSSVLQAGRHLDPSTAPDWWDTARLDRLDSLACDGQTRVLRLNVDDNTAYVILLTM